MTKCVGGGWGRLCWCVYVGRNDSFIQLGGARNGRESSFLFRHEHGGQLDCSGANKTRAPLDDRKSSIHAAAVVLNCY